MAKTKAGLKKASPRKSREETSDIEIIDGGSDAESDVSEFTVSKKDKGKTSKKGRPTPKRGAEKRRTEKRSGSKGRAAAVSDESDDDYDDVPAKKGRKDKVKLILEDKPSKSKAKEVESDDEENDASSKPAPKSVKKPGRPKKGDEDSEKLNDNKKDDSSSKKGPKKPAPKVGKKTQPLDSDEEDDLTEYEVERIIEVQNMKNGKKEFLVKWKGFSTKETTWEPEENLKSCKEMIEEFMRKLERSNVSRSRRMTTEINTMSSKNQFNRRRSTSRSRTPSTLVPKPVLNSAPTKNFSPTKVSNEIVGEKTRGLTSKLNGELPLQLYIKESTEEKLSRLAANPTSTSANDPKLRNKAESSKTISRTSSRNRHRFGTFAKVLTCGVAISSIGALLLMNSVDTLNWEKVGPHVQALLKKIKESYTGVRAKL